jgi:hypothetical protein
LRSNREVALMFHITLPSKERSMLPLRKEGSVSIRRRIHEKFKSKL